MFMSATYLSFFSQTTSSAFLSTCLPALKASLSVSIFKDISVCGNSGFTFMMCAAKCICFLCFTQSGEIPPIATSD